MASAQAVRAEPKRRAAPTVVSKRVASKRVAN